MSHITPLRYRKIDHSTKPTSGISLLVLLCDSKSISASKMEGSASSASSVMVPGVIGGIPLDDYWLVLQF